MKAITLAAQTIQLGYADVVVAGGTESMSNAPNYIPVIATANGQRKTSSSQDLLNGVIHDGLTDAYGKREHMGFKGELCAKSHRISREQQDRYAIQSYQKAHEAVHDGWFRGEITPVRVADPRKRPILVKEDELIAKVSLPMDSCFHSCSELFTDTLTITARRREAQSFIPNLPLGCQRRYGHGRQLARAVGWCKCCYPCIRRKASRSAT